MHLLMSLKRNSYNRVLRRAEALMIIPVGGCSVADWPTRRHNHGRHRTTMTAQTGIAPARKPRASPLGNKTRARSLHPSNTLPLTATICRLSVRHPSSHYSGGPSIFPHLLPPIPTVHSLPAMPIPFFLAFVITLFVTSVVSPTFHVIEVNGRKYLPRATLRR